MVNEKEFINFVKTKDVLTDKCTICENDLNVVHLIDYCNHLITESCTCEKCGIRFEPVKYILH